MSVENQIPGGSPSGTVGKVQPALPLGWNKLDNARDIRRADSGGLLDSNGEAVAGGGGGSALPVPIAPVTAIPLDGNKVFNADITSTSTPLTIAAGQVEGGSCSLVIKGNGSAWGGITGALKAGGSSSFDTGVDHANHVLVWAERGRVRYTVSQSDPVEVVPTPSAPVNTAPTIVTATAGSALVWAGASVTGYPAPSTVYSWRTSGGALIQDNISSGSYTPPAAGSFILRMTSTNTQGTDTDDVAVTVIPGIADLTSIFTASGVTQGAAGAYTITGSGLKGSSSVSASGDLVLIADYTGNTAAIAAGVATSNTAGSWTAGFAFAVIDDVGGSRWAYIEGGVQQNTLEAWSSTAANRRSRVRRVGTAVYLEASNDAGATWITLRTTTDTVGTRYPVIGSYTTGGVLKLSGQGFA
jgi:hypothetical protein